MKTLLDRQCEVTILQENESSERVIVEQKGTKRISPNACCQLFVSFARFETNFAVARLRALAVAIYRRRVPMVGRWPPIFIDCSCSFSRFSSLRSANREEMQLRSSSDRRMLMSTYECVFQTRRSLKTACCSLHCLMQYARLHSSQKNCFSVSSNVCD